MHRSRGGCLSWREAVIASLIAIALACVVVVAVRILTTPKPEVRLVCKEADKNIEIGRGHITYSDGLYRFTDASGVESTYNKSEFETCITLPIEAPH